MVALRSLARPAGALRRGSIILGALLLVTPTVIGATSNITISTAPAGSRAVVQPGDSESTIIGKLGNPRASYGTDTQTFMDYPEGRIGLINDKATDIPPALRAPAPAVAPTPAPAQAPAPVTRAPTPAPVTPPSPPAETSTPVVTAPAATGTAKAAGSAAAASSAKPAAAATGTGAKPAAPAKASEPPPEDSGFSIPIWAYVLVGLLVVFIGLKIWDMKAKQKKPADASLAAGHHPVTATTAGAPLSPPLPPAATAPPEPKKIPLPLKKAAPPPEPVAPSPQPAVKEA
ncbi:MAG TPA: hypothetical protein VHC95_00615, partial [Opitutales bacterium]|nr:hypothetical protein [Opitutales bacterium]